MVVGFGTVVGFGNIVGLGTWVTVGFWVGGVPGADGFGVAVGFATGFFLFFTVTLQTSSLFFTFAVTFVFPAFLAVTFPWLLTVAMFLLADFHFTFLDLRPRIFRV